MNIISPGGDSRRRVSLEAASCISTPVSSSPQSTSVDLDWGEKNEVRTPHPWFELSEGATGRDGGGGFHKGPGSDKLGLGKVHSTVTRGSCALAAEDHTTHRAGRGPSSGARRPGLFSRTSPLFSGGPAQKQVQSQLAFFFRLHQFPMISSTIPPMISISFILVRVFHVVGFFWEGQGGQTVLFLTPTAFVAGRCGPPSPVVKKNPTSNPEMLARCKELGEKVLSHPPFYCVTVIFLFATRLFHQHKKYTVFK